MTFNVTLCCSRFYLFVVVNSVTLYFLCLDPMIRVITRLKMWLRLQLILKISDYLIKSLEVIDS